VEKLERVGHFDSIESLNVLKEFVEAIVGTAVGFFPKFFVTDKDLIVRVDVRDIVGETILSLRCQVSHDIREHSGAGFVAKICFPVVRLNQLNHHFSYLEEVVFGVARHDY
jgi:hypothetical protein